MTHRRSPAEGTENQERDLFRARLDEMIDMSHPLVRVSEAMPWETLIESVGESLPLVPAGPGRRPPPAPRNPGGPGRRWPPTPRRPCTDAACTSPLWRNFSQS